MISVLGGRQNIQYWDMNLIVDWWSKMKHKRIDQKREIEESESFKEKR